MKGELVRKWNFTREWNDERIEAWLEGLAAEGLHLESVHAFGRYVFRRGAPARVRYRIDVAAGGRIDVDYLQLLTDAGWRMAVQRTNRYYWRNDRPDAPELFTDGPSRALKYRQLARGNLLALLCVGFVLLRLALDTSNGKPMSTFDRFALPFWLGLALYSSYAYVRLKARIRVLCHRAAL